MGIHEEIKAIREKLGITRKEFAKRLNITEIYATSLERAVSPRGGRIFIPSAKLIKKIARIGGKTPEEREKLEKKLLLEKGKLTAPTAIRGFYQEKKETYLMEGGMPLEFIARLRTDLKNCSEIADACNKGGVSKEQVDLVLEGKYILNRKKVVALAEGLQQPVDEYLLLADYMPEEVKNVVASNKNFAFFRQLSKLPAEDINKMLDVFRDVFKILKKEG